MAHFGWLPLQRSKFTILSVGECSWYLDTYHLLKCPLRKLIFLLFFTGATWHPTGVYIYPPVYI